jgi:hypothetical protein
LQSQFKREPRKDMIIVELNGGLGNQLFQYASAKSLALHGGATLKLDTRYYTANNKSHDLHYFHIDDPVACEDEIASLEKRNFVRKIADKLRPNHKRRIYREKDYTYDENFFNASFPVHLKGLRQSEKYFLPFENEIRKLLVVKPQYIRPLEGIKNEIKLSNSVFIHIRRGDYLTPTALKVLGLQPIEYYENAIRLIEERVPNPVFYIFSDDIDWAKENLRFHHPHHYASGELSKNAIEDFYLMSQCRHGILANSTFSWWAAWLNEYPEKIVIAPRKWFNQAKFDTRDLIPPSWIRL